MSSHLCAACALGFHPSARSSVYAVGCTCRKYDCGCRTGREQENEDQQPPQDPGWRYAGRKYRSMKR